MRNRFPRNCRIQLGSLENVVLLTGTESSNPSPSTGESDANLTFNFPSKLSTGGLHRPVLDLNGSDGWLTDDSPLRDG